VTLPHRRQLLHLAAGAAALPVVSHVAWAQAYPTRPVRIIVGFTAGGTTDILGRLIGRRLSERMGQQFVVENRVGAGGTVATETVVRAAPDGYTLLLASSAEAVNATLYEKLDYNFIRDIAPVAHIFRCPLVIVASPSFPAKTIPELIAYAKSNPAKVNMASAGNNGSVNHVAGELFKAMAGINMVHVPYRGAGPAIAGLLGGQVQVVLFAFVPASLQYVRTGKLRALAVTATARLEALPYIPTVGEFVPGYEASAFFGICAPKSTPCEIVEKLNREINAAVADPEVKALLADSGGAAIAASPADFGKLVADETEKWAKVIRAANIKPV
jgi:tripartite-type tricarboxylate transporter receptor subunit TctC